MQRVLSSDLWIEAGIRARKAKRRKAAIAYVTRDLLGFRKGDVLVVNASPAAISSGETDAKLLRTLVRKGVRLYHSDGLHAKVMLLDNVAIVGSGNMSRASENHLVEAGVITDGSSIVSGVASLIEQLVEQAEDITEARISQLCKIKVVRRGGRGGARPRGKTTIEKLGNQTWLVGLRELAREPTSDVQRAIRRAAKALQQSEEDLDYIVWRRPTKFSKECRAGDSLIQIWRSRSAKRPYAVFQVTPVLLKQTVGQKTMFYVQTPMGKFDEMPWGRFVRLLKKLGYPKKVGPNISQHIEPEMADAIVRSWKSAFKA